MRPLQNLQIEKDLLALPENALVRVCFKNAKGEVFSIHDSFVDDLMVKRGGSSKRKDKLKPYVKRVLDEAHSFSIKPL